MPRHKFMIVTTFFFLSSGLSFAGDVTAGQQSFDKGEYSQAFMHFSKAFADGHSAGGYYMGRMLELGLGVGQDRLAAFKFYQKGADAQHVPSMNRVALMYFRGEEGVKQSYDRAFSLFDAASRSGNANATFNLGKLYFEGKGAPKNAERSIALYKKAAGQDHILALNTLGALYRGSPDDKEKALARSYFERSAAFGNGVGLFETGLSSLHKGNTRENLRTAHKYFNLASARGFEKASAALQEVTILMLPEDITAAQADARIFIALVPVEAN